MHRQPVLSDFPTISGALSAQSASCRELGRNFGHHLESEPLAVLHPATSADIAKAVRWATKHQLPVGIRGQAHSTHGQTSAHAGLLIDMRSMSAVLEVTDETLVVQAGARWSDVLQATLRVGRVPPTLADYQGLSVGGTLSVGGIGGESFRVGSQLESARELEVVVGTGDVVRCSPSENCDLFDACRGGLGQFGIITTARIQLTAAPRNVQTFLIECSSLHLLLSALEQLAHGSAYHHLYGNIHPHGEAQWQFQLVASVYGAADEARALVSSEAFLRNCGAKTVTMEERTFSGFAHRADFYVRAMQDAGTWAMAHPWLDLFVPSASSEEFIRSEMERAESDRRCSGDMLVYPMRRGVCRAPSLRVPAQETFILFDVLRNTPTAPEDVNSVLAANREAYERCLRAGGTLYPIGSMPMARKDWERHYADHFEAVLQAKKRFDPEGSFGTALGLSV